MLLVGYWRGGIRRERVTNAKDVDVYTIPRDDMNLYNISFVNITGHCQPS